MHKTVSTRIGGVLLSAAVLASLLPAGALAAGPSFTDTQGHWAESAIARWGDYGVVTGLGNGTFAPDAELTRAEMAQVYVNLFKLTEKADISNFADIPAGAWYADAVSKCVAAGILNGTSNVTFSPLAPVTREQMFAAFGRALDLAPAETTNSTLYDLGQVSDWAQGTVNALLNAGYVTGTTGNTLLPLADIDRASVVALLDKSVAGYGSQPGSTVSVEGKGGLVLVVSGGVTVTGQVGDLVIAQSAAEGTVQLADAAVTGTVTLSAPSVKLNITGGSKVENLMVSAQAGDAEITVEKDASVNALTTEAQGTIVSGQGTVSRVEAAEGSGNVTVTTTGTAIENNSSSSVTTGKGEVKPGSTASTGGGSSSGGGSSGGGSGGITVGDLTISEAKTVTGGTYRNVTIASSVGDGTVTLENLTIQGTLTVNGGGSGTVNLIRCRLGGTVVLDKADGQPPRLNLTSTPVTAVEAVKPAILEADAASAITAVTARANVEVKGEQTAVAAITVPADAENEVTVTVTAGSVARVEARSETTVTGAAGSVASVMAGATVTVASEAVELVEVPENAAGSVDVSITGSAPIEVEINSSNGAAITADVTGSVTVSTSADSAPEHVTLDGQTVTHLHKWDDGTVTTPATCQQAGVKTYTCIAEGCTTPAVTKQEGIPMLPHTQVTDPAVSPTCTTTGKTEGAHCSVCGTVLVTPTEIAALGHDFTGPYLYDQEGHWHKCSRCEAVDTKAAHSWDSGVTAETITTYTCTVCGATKTETILPEGANTLKWTSAGIVGWDAVTDINWYKLKVLSGNDVVYTSLVKGNTNTTYNLYTCLNELSGDLDQTYDIQVWTCADFVQGQGYQELEKIGELKDAISLTVQGEPVGYTFEVTGEKSYNLHLNDGTPDGARIWSWENAEGVNRDARSNSGGNQMSYENETRYYAFENGDIICVRIMTDHSLTDDVWHVTMTPASTQTYTASSTPAAASVRWDSDTMHYNGTLRWDAVEGADRYLVSVYEGDTVGDTPALTRQPAEPSYNMHNSLMTLAGESDGTYSVKVDALQDDGTVIQEVGRLDGAISLTVSGTAPSYSITAESGQAFTINFAEGTPDGFRAMFWKNGNSSEYSVLSTLTGLTGTGTKSTPFAKGDTCHLRIFSSREVNSDCTVWSVTLTPTSTMPGPSVSQSVTAVPTNIHLEQTAYGLQLVVTPIPEAVRQYIQQLGIAYTINGTSYSRSWSPATVASTPIPNWDALTVGTNNISMTFTATPTTEAAAAGYTAGSTTFEMTINYQQSAAEDQPQNVTATFTNATDESDAVIEGMKKLTVTGLKANQAYQAAVRVGADGTVNYREFTTDENGTGVSEWYTTYAFTQCTLKEWVVTDVTGSSATITSCPYTGTIQLNSTMGTV